jgi:hypothetical protein
MSSTATCEKTRGRFAQMVVWALVAATAGALVLLALGRVTAQDLLGVAGVAAPLVGIVGAAIGSTSAATNADIVQP